MNIELLRMVCAVGVVLAHLRVFPTNNITNEYLSLGAIGVDFFFLISGYSMMAMLKKYNVEDRKASVFLF
jgi:peptidoglycan/LPS O-acetylase OafA/YrhL